MEIGWDDRLESPQRISGRVPVDLIYTAERGLLPVGSYCELGSRQIINALKRSYPGNRAVNERSTLRRGIHRKGFYARSNAFVKG